MGQRAKETIMKRKTNVGFTLIELMIVVAIIGVLAVLAIFGVGKYLRSAKAAEGTNALGSIQQEAVEAYNKESTPAGIAVGLATGTSHNLCPSSAAVPNAPPSNKKYTADPTKDYATDSGFSCLGFSMSQPQYFSYQYEKGKTVSTIAPDAKVAGTDANGWVDGASADFDGTGKLTEFATGGTIISGAPVTATSIATWSQAAGAAF
jgi:type IV pilus assembly protein PilA